MAVVVKTVLGSHFRVGELTTPILEPMLSGDWDGFNWGYDLDFDPWPCEFV